MHTLHDCDDSGEPQLARSALPEWITKSSRHAKGMMTCEIAAAFKERYDADVSPVLVSKVTDAVMVQITGYALSHCLS